MRKRRKRSSLELLPTEIVQGTLPLAWEKVYQVYAYTNTPRNTPTCVGKSMLSADLAAIVWEHSHLCGKKDDGHAWCIYVIGTLPLTWEKDLVFMRLPKIFDAICNQIFYKFLCLFVIDYFITPLLFW